MKKTVFFLLMGLCFPTLAYSDTTYVVPPPEVVAEREAQKHVRAERVHRAEARSDLSSAHQDRVDNHQNAANTRQDNRQDASNNHQDNQQERANDRQNRASQRR